MTEIELAKLLITVIGAGFTGLIGVIAYFTKRLVVTQDKQGDKLGEHDNRITKTEVEIVHLKAKKAR